MPKLVDGQVVAFTSDAVALGRFQHGGVLGYVAATMPDAVMRPTRAEAMEDERLHYETKWCDTPHDLTKNVLAIMQQIS